MTLSPLPFFLFALCILLPLSAQAQEEPLTRIAFGSCCREGASQPIWKGITESRPGLWIWLGDNIYGDTEDMAVMAKKWARQKAVPGYVQLRETCPVIGTWDDHDYGANDAGKEYPMREQSQKAFLDFLDEPADSPRRERKGVYASYTYGPEGQRVKVLVLDTRYHRDKIGNREGDILGQQQWHWLHRKLNESDAQVHVIVSSIQVIPSEHRFEKWANFPRAKHRLFEMLDKYATPGVVFLSGDRHHAEISRKASNDGTTLLHEVTSSSMTHSRGTREEANQQRIGKIYGENNFGVLEINWQEAATPILRLQLRSENNTVERELVYEVGR